MKRALLLSNISAVALAVGLGVVTTEPRVVVPPAEPKPEPTPKAKFTRPPRPVNIGSVSETRLVADRRIRSVEADAAAKVADEGGTARDQIDAAQAAAGRAIKYTPHVGKRQRERELKRMAKRREEYEFGSDPK